MMKRIITQWTAALALLVALAIPIGMRGESTTVASFSRSGSSNTTSGGTFTTTFSAKTGYYQDANGDCYMQILNNTAYWTTTPNSISFAAKIGGGSGSHELTDPVYVALLDANGDVISGTRIEVTSYITTNTGDDYNISIPVTNNVYGVKLSHNKENGFNVRYYSFSLSYEEGSGSQTESHTLTFSAEPEEGGTVIVGSSNSGSITLEENATVNITATPAEVGYAFSNWTVSGTGASVGSTTSATTTFTMGTEDVTLTANFTAVTIYTVIYHANVTGITDIEVVYNAGDDVTVAANTFSNPGFAFSEWNTQADGDGDPYVAGDIIENIQANIDLYAQWEESSETTATLNIQSYANAHSWSNGVQYLTATVDQVTFTAVGGGNTGKYYTSGQDWRYYQGESATITISVPNGYHLVSITPTYTSSNGGALLNGSATIQSGSTVDVSGTSVTFSVGNSSSATNGQVKFTNIDVTYASEGGTPAPSISASNVNIAYNVTFGSIEYTINNGVDGGILTAATESNWLTLGTVGETVPFTCSANEAATERTATVTLTYAYGDTETVTVTKDVTITQAAAPVIYTTIPALFAAATGDETDVLVTFNNWVVSGVSTTGKNVFVTDNDGNGFVIYSNSDMSSTYSAGDILAGTAVSCTLKKYNGFAELLNVDASDLTITDGGTVTAAEIDMADLAGVNTGALVHYDNLTCSITNSKYYLSDGTTTLQVYNSLYDFGSVFVADHVYNITGVYQQYNTNNGDTKEILPRSAADIEEVVSAYITVDPDEINLDGVSQDGYLTIAYDDLDIQGAQDFDIQFYDTNNQTIEKPEWMIEANVTTQVGEEGYFVYYMVGTNEDQLRTARFKVKVSDTYSNLVTITQAKVVPFINLLAVNEGDDPYVINYTHEISGGYPDKIQHGYFSATSGANSFHIQYYDNEGQPIDAGPDWIEQVTVVDAPSWISSTYALYVSIFENEGPARAAYFKVWALDNDDNPVYSSLVTLNQGAIDYATLPFAWEEGNYGTTPAGITNNGVDTGSGDAYLKFNNTDDYITLKINERPGELTFNIKANPSENTWEGIFKVQTSTNGTDYTDVLIYDANNMLDLSNYQEVSLDDLDENVRYIMWIYTSKTKGNVAVKDINLAKYTEPVVVPSITLNAYTIEATAEETEGALDITYENLTITDESDFAIQYYDAEGEEIEEPGWISTEVSEKVISKDDPTYEVTYVIGENDGAARTTYFKVWALDDENNEVYSNLVTVTQAAAPAMALYSYSINGVEGQTIVAEMGATIILANGENLNDDFTFAGWTTDANDVSLRFTGEYTLSDDVTVFYAVYKREGTVSVINTNTENFPTTYGQANIFKEYTLNGKQFMIRQAYNNNTHVLQFRAAGNNNGTGTLYNNESLGTINSIVLNYNPTDTKKNFTVFAGTNANPTDGVQIEPAINDDTYTFDLSNGNYSYFVMTNGENAGYLNSITINATNCSADYYTRVFQNETATGNITITGPSIIPANYYLDTDGNTLSNSNADNLIIEDGAKLRHMGSCSATVQKNIVGYENYSGDGNGGYYLISNPIKFEYITEDYVPSSDGSDGILVGNYDLYKWDYKQNDEWINFKLADNEFTCLTTGWVQNGYLYANETGTTLIFKGLINAYSGDKTRYNDLEPNPENYDFPDWYLLGNPYLYDAYLADNNETDQALPYYRMNADGDGLEAAVAGTPIAPLEGYFFHATAEAPNANLVTYVPTASAKSQLNMSLLRDGKQMDNAIVAFGDGQRLEKFSFRQGSSKVYMTEGNKDYAIVRSAAQGEMPVSFKASKNGTYTLSVEPENVEMNYLHLIDNMTGADVDLLATPSYSFEARTTDYANRFRLVFNANTINENGNETFAFFNGSEWVISNMGDATLQVIDMMGRVLRSEQISGNTTVNINEIAGVYMLRLVNGENVMVQKVVVR